MSDLKTRFQQCLQRSTFWHVRGVGMRWPRASTFVITNSLILLPLASLICICVDISKWQSKILCEQESICNNSNIPINSNLLVKCKDMDDAVQMLFWFYSVTIATITSRVCLCVIFKATHTMKFLPSAAALDWSTIERGVAGAVFWGTMIVMELVSAATCIYRVGWIPRTTNPEQLYPTMQHNTDLKVWRVAYIVCSALSLLLTVYATTTRALALRHYLNKLRLSMKTIKPNKSVKPIKLVKSIKPKDIATSYDGDTADHSKDNPEDHETIPLMKIIE